MRQRHVTRRASVAVAALVIHGVLFLVAIRVRTPMREAPALPQFISLWMTQAAPPTVIEPEKSPRDFVDRSVDPPETSAPDDTQDEQVDSPQPEPSEAPPARVDWMREGALVARGVGSALQTEESEAFSGAVPKMREACVPKETRFKWNPEEKRVGFSGLLPFLRIGNCIVGPGFFACPLGEQPQPNSHLFDDMVASNRQESSVPDVDYCD